MNIKSTKPYIYYSPLYVKASEYLFHSSKATVFTRIAAGIIEKINEFPNVNIEELALYCDTTPPSVTKFCRIIGYNSFAELRNNINHYNSTHPQFPLHDERAILDNIYSYLPREQCDAMAAVLASKKKILIITNEFTFNISNMLKETLSNLGRTVYLAHRENDELIFWLFQVTDCILVLTFTGDWMEKQAWCSNIPAKQCLLLISSRIPEIIRSRPEIWVSVNDYPYLMTSNYHSHKYMESIAYNIAKSVKEIT